MKFAATFAPAEEGGYVVTFRDIPEAITQGDDADEATMMATDALASAMDFYIEDGRPVPVPSPPRPGERLIALPDDVAGRIRALNAALARK
jgi:antitoxin HicB